MFCFRPPSEHEVQAFVARQSRSAFSYPDVSASASRPPRGYVVDHHRVQLGRGEAVWTRAMGAVRRWQMFAIPWMRLYWPNSPIRVGTDVAISVRHFGFYSLNACRIVYVVDEKSADFCRYGFAYGTLEEHAARGEERFTVEWSQTDDGVWYDILAFSRPHHLLSLLGYPLTRSIQRRFAAASTAAMIAAVTSQA